MNKKGFAAVLLAGWAIYSLAFVQALQAKNQCSSTTGYAQAVPRDLIVCKAAPMLFRDRTEAQWYITESGYIAAVEEDLLDRAIFWAGMGDELEFMRFIASNELVFPLKGGLRVRLEKFSFSGKVKIRPEGSTISVWTVREAIRSELPVESS